MQPERVYHGFVSKSWALESELPSSHNKEYPLLKASAVRLCLCVEGTPFVGLVLERIPEHNVLANPGGFRG